jgi:heparan-alpha-glucosaminide N-acetyltransferase
MLTTTAQRGAPFTAETQVRQERSARIVSVDVLRGLVVLVMIFVNDVASVPGAPAWMKHVDPHDADGMTFVDVVFPAFLFVVGMAIPLSVGRRLDAGEPVRSVWRGVLARTAALLVIGVLMVNTETIARDGIVPAALWTLLMYVGVLLAWTRWGGAGRAAMRVAGVALLVALAFLYRGNEATGLLQLRPQWWGILGLIGWAYLVGCAAYTLFRRELGALIGVVALLYLLFVADAVGFFAWASVIDRWVDIGAVLGSHAAVTVSGVALGVVVSPGSRWPTPAARLRWALLYGAGLFVAGQLVHSAHGVHRLFIINKIEATPAWCLVSSAYTVWLWAAVYWLVDVRGRGRSAAVGTLDTAGQSALLAYVLPGVFYAALGSLALAGVPDLYFAMSRWTAAGIARAALFAIGIVWLTSRLTRRGVRFRV